MTAFIPKVIESNHYHLWTDVLHARKLAKQTRNKWDCASYVRWSIISSWIVLEIACQDALSEPNISYRFRENMDDAIKKSSLTTLNWENGIWQKVINLQKIRNNIVHRFQKENNLFSEISDADEAIFIVREAVKEIYNHTNKNYPLWIEDDEDRGWDGRGFINYTTVTVHRNGSKRDDFNCIKIYFVTNGIEKLSEVLSENEDYNQAVDNILYNSKEPISKVFVKQYDQIIFNKDLNMRGT